MGSKYIIIGGGVYSGTGKGISGASIGLLLKMRGANVQLIKCDPYLNINAGTMNPKQHGEVFLCNDGSETDMDLGHYERITGIEMSSRNIFTSGIIHQELLTEVENGKYLGETIQVIPHLTNKIIERITNLGKDADIVIAEIGGTVGDMESEAFYDAARQMKQAMGDDVLFIMVAPILWNAGVKESKTKPLQNSVKALQMRGVRPDILLCRTDFDQFVSESLLQKIATQTGVDRSSIFLAPQVRTIYEVPIEFWKNHVDDLIADKFHLRRNGCRIHKYRDLVENYLDGQEFPQITIGIAGKYENCDEAYHSLKEALMHAAVQNSVRMDIRWINVEEIESAKKTDKFFNNIQGLIVPGGFDIRGIEGKIKSIQHVREKKIPFLGICLGLQCSVIEFARNVLGIANATSEEFNHEAEHKVIHYVAGQEGLTKKSATMRLGAFDCEVKEGSVAHELYGKLLVSERHRHRYEVNPSYIEQMAQRGFLVSGNHVVRQHLDPMTGLMLYRPDGKGFYNLVEIMELDRSIHPFFVGTQAHPEFRSRLGDPNPLFNGLVKAAKELYRMQTTKAQ